MDDFEEESKTFDKQSGERVKNGFVPDLRKLKEVDWFYNNVWRDPKFVEIHMMPRVNFVLDIVKSYPRKSKIIEMGCGYGYLSLEMARLGMDVSGIDISPKSIEIAKNFSIKSGLEKELGSLNYICDNVVAREFGSEIFDIVVFFSSLHHIPNASSVIDKAYRSLKNGGSVILVEPIQNKFTKSSAEFAAIMRVLSPTWISYNEKIKNLDNSDNWDKYVDDIYNEYMYEGEHKQSGLDNVCSSDLEILGYLRENDFQILKTEYESAFIDKLIGGLRGEHKYVLARFLKFLDDELVKKEILPPTVMRVHAIKNIRHNE